MHVIVSSNVLPPVNTVYHTLLLINNEGNASLAD